MEGPPALVEAAPQPKRHVRRSQKPVPKVPGQLRLVAGGACIPAPAKVGFCQSLTPISACGIPPRWGARSGLQKAELAIQKITEESASCSCCQRQV